ncbi:dioxygenase [Rhodococcus sp. IEGM 1307]|uniref:dioxygenase family protein n=1 Tax=Rhodococcus sp. IEGM 1307 TaxID=3047091 RepID=UPI0024B84538|nr:dioxygenase [Rhodococcus sp. IEGM 1307]MDI9978880.1 dioxygenase [Rhodococcus sp. IEGM 1307]
MATDFSETTATDAVVRSFSETPDDRLKAVLTSLTVHLHNFVREIEPTQHEWEQGIDFLTDVGHMCDGIRQEFILLSDVLGVSMLVDAINNRKPVGATESTVLGPFHVVDSPELELGSDIALAGDAKRCVVRGKVRSVDSSTIPGAVVDVWQADDAGFYDIQLPDLIPERNLRGLFTADDEGAFWFRTIIPKYYPIPADGPVGNLLRASHRHPYRPAHIHFISGAEGYSPVTTHLFIEGSPYLDDDTVFGVKESLVRAVQQVDDAPLAQHYGVANPFDLIEFDIVLNTVADTARVTA